MKSIVICLRISIKTRLSKVLMISRVVQGQNEGKSYNQKKLIFI